MNEGIYLENLDKGNYYLFIRAAYKNESQNVYDYYALENNTDYSESEYYTLSSQNKKIVINTDDYYETMMFNITDNTDDVYDVVIDPGHGGIDSGSTNGEYKESELVMEFSKILYDKLTDLGLKVKLTREEDSLDDDEYFDEYNTSDNIGRAVIAKSVSAKYVFSIHLNSLENSTQTRGLEIYTASGINYNFASSLASAITTNTSIPSSSKLDYKVSDGVYTHNFTTEEVENSLFEYDRKGYTRYNVTTNSSYLYMIRETGGIITGAYVDDSNEEVGENPYYDSNVGVEAYLLELGYISNYSDLNYIVNNMEDYADVIAQAIYDYVTY